MQTIMGVLERQLRGITQVRMVK